LDVIAESKNYVQNFVDHFEEMSLIKNKEGMKTIVKQIIVDCEKTVASVLFESFHSSSNILFLASFPKTS
jgi:hypothetical protein